MMVFLVGMKLDKKIMIKRIRSKLILENSTRSRKMWIITRAVYRKIKNNSSKRKMLRIKEDRNKEIKLTNQKRNRRLKIKLKNPKTMAKMINNKLIWIKELKNHQVIENNKKGQAIRMKNKRKRSKTHNRTFKANKFIKNKKKSNNQPHNQWALLH